MSRYYNMNITVFGALTDEEKTNVEEALKEEWDFDDFCSSDYDKEFRFSAEGQGNLCGGATEEDFHINCSHAAWKALGRYAKVEVVATYLDDLPYEVHTSNKKAYARFKKAS